MVDSNWGSSSIYIQLAVFGEIDSRKVTTSCIILKTD